MDNKGKNEILYDTMIHLPSLEDFQIRNRWRVGDYG